MESKGEDLAVHLPLNVVQKESLVSFEWVRSSQLLVFAKNRIENQKRPASGAIGRPVATRSQSSSTGSPLIDLKWSVSLFEEKATRGLVSESATLFQSLQRKDPKSDPLSMKEILKGSRKYRSVIHVALERLKQEAQREAVVFSFHEIEIVWHLCEILFLDIHGTGILLTQLLSWIRWHFPDANVKAEDLLRQNNPHQHPSFWDVVLGFVLRGETENARNLLKLHPDHKREEFQLVCELLRNMPTFAIGQAAHEFDMRWHSWSEECDLVIETPDLFDNQDNLRLIVRLLAGQEDAFKDVHHLLGSWFHLLVVRLLFTDPCIRKDLSSLSRECRKQFYSSTPSSSFDRVLVAAFSYDLMEVIRESCNFSDNWWFVSHLIDLFYNGNQLNDHQVAQDSDLREFFLLEYANSLMSHSSLWQVSLDYFDACHEKGQQFLHIGLERMATESERKALKVMVIAERRGLKGLSKSIAKITAKKWLNRNRLGSALVWAVKSEDPLLTSHLADLYLMEYAKTGHFPDDEVLSTLGPNLLLSDRLTFLGKYYEFHILKKRGLLPQAAELLVSLISSRISPKFFVVNLLMDSLPLLEAQSLVVNSDQTCQILGALEDIFDSQQNKLLKRKEETDSVTKEGILRLAIARNMARAFLCIK